MPPPPILLRIAYGPSCLGSPDPSGSALFTRATLLRLAGLLLGRRVAGRADRLLATRDAAEDLVHVGAVDRLAFQQQLGEAVQRVAVLAEHVHGRSEEHTSELQSRFDLVCRL